MTNRYLQDALENVARDIWSADDAPVVSSHDVAALFMQLSLAIDRRWHEKASHQS